MSLEPIDLTDVSEESIAVYLLLKIESKKRATDQSASDCCLLQLFFDPKAAGTTVLRNVGEHPPDGAT
jgi:hypothetical protein